MICRVLTGQSSSSSSTPIGGGNSDQFNALSPRNSSPPPFPLRFLRSQSRATASATFHTPSQLSGRTSLFPDRHSAPRTKRVGKEQALLPERLDDVENWPPIKAVQLRPGGGAPHAVWFPLELQGRDYAHRALDMTSNALRKR